MSDTPPPTSAGDGRFCGECGAAVESDATFCGSCGSPLAAAGAGAEPHGAGGPDDATAPGGASNWDGVQTVVDRGEAPPSGPATVPVPNMPPPPGPTTGPPSGPPPGPPAGPPVGAPPGAPTAEGGEGKGKGNGPKVVVALVAVVALLVGAFLVLGGGDDDGGDEAGDDTTFERDDDDDDADPGETTTTAAEGDTTTTEAGGETTAPPAGGFVNLVDDTGRLTIDVPDDWIDVALVPEEGLPRILAAPDTQAFETAFEVPGVDLRLLDAPLPPAQFDTSLDTVADTIGLPNSCTSQGKQDFAGSVFTGRMEVWAECAGIGTQMALVFANQADGQTVFIGLQLTAADDPAIADRIFGSFLIVG